MGDASFSQMFVGKNAFFDSSLNEIQNVPIQFERNVHFDGSHFLGNARFIGAKFKGKANFNLAQFDGNALFSHSVDNDNYEVVQFEGAALFISSIFKQIANFRGADFKDLADFRGAEIRGTGLFIGAVFHSSANFRDARFSIAVFREEDIDEAWSDISMKSTVYTKGHPHQFCGKVDMRGFSYERLYVSWEEILSKLFPYDRQPYVQAEKSLHLAGYDKQAESVYLARRKRERQRLRDNVLRRGDYKDVSFLDSIKELPIWLLDKSQQLLFNYGVRPYRLILLSFLVIGVGTLVFSRAGAVMPKEREARSKQVSEIKLSKSEAFNVSLNQFIPIVEIAPADEWIPSNKSMPILGLFNMSFAGYAAIHKIFGAILIPLGLAALTGLLRRIEK